MKTIYFSTNSASWDNKRVGYEYKNLSKKLKKEIGIPQYEYKGRVKIKPGERFYMYNEKEKGWSDKTFFEMGEAIFCISHIFYHPLKEVFIYYVHYSCSDSDMNANYLKHQSLADYPQFVQLVIKTLIELHEDQMQLP